MATLSAFVDAVDIALRIKRSGLDEPWVGNDVVEDHLRRGWVEARLEELLSDINPRRVRLARVSMNSPLLLELFVTGASGVGISSAVVYLFKNPEKIGAWFPKLRTSWYNGQAEAEKARKAYEKLRKARTKVRELEP
ncbi:hypothetical protein ACFYY8_18585 [Streptosporangium sp. NPDC001559]|uniref:hypothetical protein n=1 Tax=Streptosporangium sp. NPDC001559 TaxID=3366187 RepID=UPI0036E335C7